MSKIAKAQVFNLAQAVGLQLDDARADMIASRLSGVLDELDGIPDEDLAGVEPLPIFIANVEAQNG